MIDHSPVSTTSPVLTQQSRSPRLVGYTWRLLGKLSRSKFASSPLRSRKWCLCIELRNELLCHSEGGFNDPLKIEQKITEGKSLQVQYEPSAGRGPTTTTTALDKTTKETRSVPPRLFLPRPWKGRSSIGLSPWGWIRRIGSGLSGRRSVRWTTKPANRILRPN